MASLPREVHEVLEQEYVSMYGPLAEVPVKYRDEDIRDCQWALSILRACKLADDDVTKAAAVERVIRKQRELLAKKLNDLVSVLDPALLAQSPALTENGRELLRRYDDLRRMPHQDIAELHRRILDDAFTGAVVPLRNLRLSNVYRALHERAADPTKARTALCISGGGIRSATFALGVVQGLASAKVLDKFDYLSTVSGGGYIASWLSSWTRRHPHGISGVQDDLARSDVAAFRKPGPNDEPERLAKLEPEPRPVRHLRDHSNYLSPRLGLLSGDAWTMGALYVRNLVLNLLVIVPILALVLAVPRLFSLLARSTYVVDARVHLVLAVIAIGIAFAYIGRRRPVDHERPEEKKKKEKKRIRQRTADSQFVRRCTIPLTFAAVMISLFWGAVKDGDDVLRDPITLGIAGAAVLAMTLIPYLLYYRRFDKAYQTAFRTTHTGSAELRSHLARKRLAEFAAATLGLVTTAVLLWVVAYQVFDNPLQLPEDLIEAAAKSPAERVGLSLTPWAAIYTIFSVPAVLLVFFVQATVFVGVASHYSEEYDREWWGRAGAWLLIAAAAWATLSAIALFGPVGLYHAPVLLGSVGGLSGLAAGLLGFSAKTPANKKKKEQSGRIAQAGNAALGLAVPLFVVFFLSLISLGTTWLVQQFEARKTITNFEAQSLAFKATVESKAERTRKPESEHLAGVDIKESTAAAPLVSIPLLRSFEHLRTVYRTTWLEIVVLGAIGLGAWLLSFCIGVNKFSMHALYRNRLVRAYLGASRYWRSPNPFTGFDDKDDLPMYRLRPELLWATNLHKPDDFFRALTEGKRSTQTGLQSYRLGRRKLAQELWRRFSDKTRNTLDQGVSGGSIDAVIQNINDILLDEKEPLEEVVIGDLPDDFWALPKKQDGDGKRYVPYPVAIRNRAVLDWFFKDVLTPMPAPKDVEVKDEKAMTKSGADDSEETGTGRGRRAPLHVVNIALNLVAGEKLAWQQRKAETFTVSPYDAGSVFLGYRDSRVYGGPAGISLGTAATISGAAASPNMGYHSSPALGFLLTLFNIRLGWWLGNPGTVGQKSFPQEHPTTNLGPIFAEAIGQTNDTYEWVYLSDGGHFENLGLYEMVLRRCHYIVLSDAGADPQFAFEDLGNAIRKIRTDFGVPIDIEEMYMVPRGDDGLMKEGRYVATATIRYSAVDGENAKDGLLIYLKPGCYDDPYFPRDVFNYAKESLEFPHEPTSDQFFSESQFESYRALGRHAINEICRNYPDRTQTRPRIPIAKEFAHVPEFATFVEEKAAREERTPPETLVAKAIREASQRPLLRR